MSIPTPRRYYLLKSYIRLRQGEDGLAAFWWGKQASVAGTALPAKFPHEAQLAVARYTTVEDLTGATADELRRNAGLSNRDAQTVIAAAALLIP